MKKTRTVPAALAAALPLLGAAGCTAVDDDGAEAIERGAAGAPGQLQRVDRVAYADDGLPYFIRGDLGTVDRQAMASDDAAALGSALPAIAAAFRLAPEDLVATEVQRDRLGMTHVRYQQHKHGLPVIGGDLVVHVAAGGTVRSVTSNARDGVDVSPTPVVSADAASATARDATAGGRSNVHGAELVYVFSTKDHALHLAWQVGVVGRDELVMDLVYVDAHSGAVVDRRPQVHTAKNRVIYNANGASPPFFSPPGAPLISEGGTTTDQIGRAAYDNTGLTYDCYHALYGRDSYNGSGAQLTSYVHVVFSVQGMRTGNNAAWIGSALGFNFNHMVYGDGDGVNLLPLAQSFDVTAHELTHAVTNSTANLAYQNESGALNEGMSDIMAAVCEAWKDHAVSANTWLVGETILTPSMPNDALRYMANPTADANPRLGELMSSRDFYPERYTGTVDQGGVHFNSGIANLAFYLLSQGGTHPRGKTTFNVPAIGIDKAGAIFQRALTQGYFTSTTTFAQARTATEEAAGDLYTPSEVTAVSLAWAAVGVGQPPAGTDTTPPTVQITSPTNGATVAPGFTVDVTAQDNVGVLRVELSIDGSVVGTDTTAPYSFTAPASITSGTHTVKATAFDAANQASASIDVTVSTGGGGGDGDGDGNPDDGDDSGGCCSTSSDAPPAGLGLLLVAVGLGLRRRRPAS